MGSKSRVNKGSGDPGEKLLAGQGRAVRLPAPGLKDKNLALRFLRGWGMQNLSVNKYGKNPACSDSEGEFG